MAQERPEWVRALCVDLLAQEARIEEALRRISRARAVGPIEARLEAEMSAVFLAQGRALGRRLAQGASGRSQESVRLAARLGPATVAVREAFADDDWGPLFEQAARETDGRFGWAIEAAARAALTAGARAALSAGARAALTAQLGISWSLRNPRAVAYLDAHGAALVTRINETTRDDLRSLIARGIEAGRSYDQIAEDIQTQFRHYYDPGSYWAFDASRPQRHIDSRAHLIAVTESGQAYVEGNLIVGRDLAAAGLPMEKMWLTVGDDRVSAGCQENAGAGWIPLDEPFPSGDMAPLRFPGCRCDVLMQVAEGR